MTRYLSHTHGHRQAQFAPTPTAPLGHAMPMRHLIVPFLTLALCACSYTVAERNLVIPRAGEAIQAGTRGDGRWIVEPLDAKAEDGTLLHGAKFKRTDSVATVLYFGGNGFVLSRHADHVLAVYRDLPVDVVVFDHRGYGANPGATSIDALFRDGLALYDQTREAAPTRLLLVHGHSLGSFIAGHIASERRLDGLILESTATTAEEWARRRAGLMRFLIRIRVEPALQEQGNLSLMHDLDEPVLFATGKEDTITKPIMARELYETAAVEPVDKRLLIVPGAAVHVQFSGVGHHHVRRVAVRTTPAP